MSEITRGKAISTGASLLLANGCTAVAGIVTARALGPQGKGVVAAVLAWPQLASWLLLAGLGVATALRVAESRESALTDALGNAVLHCVLIGAVGTAAGLALLPGILDHLGGDAAATTRLAVLAIPLSMLSEVTMGINLSLGRTRRYNAARAATGLTVLVICVILVIVGAVTARHVVAATIAGGLVSLAIAARGLPWRRLVIVLPQLGRDLQYGARVFLTSLLGLVNLRLDVLLMSAFLAADKIGLYTVAFNALLPIAIVTTTGTALIMPAVGRARGDRAGESSADGSFVRRTALRFGLVSSILAVLIAVALPWALPLLFGEAFQPAVQLAWILLPGFVAQGYANMVDAGTVGMRRPWVGNASQGAGVLVTAALLPFLLPRYGSTGAAIVSTLSYSATAVVAVWALGRVQRDAIDTGKQADLQDAPPEPVVPTPSLPPWPG